MGWGVWDMFDLFVLYISVNLAGNFMVVKIFFSFYKPWVGDNKKKTHSYFIINVTKH